jgi:cation diffusion facilitator CzcD-associated flavoprotein CzcO
MDATGISTTDEHFEFDSVIYATGFDAMTGALTRIDIRGAGDAALADAWEDGPRNYLGLCVAGFPNFYVITGPGSPSVLSNMMMAIEQHVDWVADAIEHMPNNGKATIEASEKAQEDWVEHVADAGNVTLYPLANFWYLCANVPGKTRVFLPYIGGFGPYGDLCDQVAANGYEGFMLA